MQANIKGSDPKYERTHTHTHTHTRSNNTFETKEIEKAELAQKKLEILKNNKSWPFYETFAAKMIMEFWDGHAMISKAVKHGLKIDSKTGALLEKGAKIASKLSCLAKAAEGAAKGVRLWHLKRIAKQFSVCEVMLGGDKMQELIERVE